MEYLTDDDYKQAEENGISRMVAYNRFYNYGWDKNKTITHPVKRTKLWDQYKEKCWENGVSNNNFHRRIKNGWTPEKAATTPSLPINARKHKNPKVTPEILELANQNGINKNTLSYRIYALKWDTKRAATEKVDKTKNKKSLESWGL